jgi:hypothetical protein
MTDKESDFPNPISYGVVGLCHKTLPSRGDTTKNASLSQRAGLVATVLLPKTIWGKPSPYPLTFNSRYLRIYSFGNIRANGGIFGDMGWYGMFFFLFFSSDVVP